MKSARELTPAIDNLRGAGCILVSCVLFTAMAALAKLLGERLPTVEVAFARAFFGLALVLPFAFRAGIGTWRTHRPFLHITRGALGTAGLTCAFYAVNHLPLAEATALSFTKPLFQVLLAALVLRELINRERWLATAIGLCGVLIMLRPSVNFGLGGGAVAVGLAGALCGALVSVTLRQMVQVERELTILLYLGIVGSLLTGVPASFVWVWPSGVEFLLMLAMGVVGMISQLFLMRGFRLGEASAMAPFDYARLPISAFWGFLLFAETPSPLSLAGATIIAASSVWLARREALRARAVGLS